MNQVEQPAIARAIDARALRNVLGTFPTGVTVVTTVDAQGRRYGVTANSFSSVSLNPPLILWNQALASPSYPAFREAKRFVVNILAEDQVDISKRFATSGIDKFAGVSTRPGLGGVPLIEGCAAHIECVSETSFPGGDHAVFIGRIEKTEHGERKPLVFGGGSYLTIQPFELGPTSDELAIASVAHLHVVRVATAAMPALSRRLGTTIALTVWGNCGPTVIRWEQPAVPLSANLRTGMVCELLTCATGRAFAAWHAADATAPMLDKEFGAHPSETVDLRRREMEEILDAIRQQGFAAMRASPIRAGTPGREIYAVCVPAFGAQGQLALCLTAVAPAEEADKSWEDTTVAALKDAARAISSRMAA